MVVVTKSPPDELVEVCVVVVVELDDEGDPEAVADDAVEVVVEFVSVTVTVTTFFVVVCGASDEFVVLLPEAFAPGFCGGNKIWAPLGACEGPCPLRAPVATTSEPAAASTTRIKMEMTDSLWIKRSPVIL